MGRKAGLILVMNAEFPCDNIANTGLWGEGGGEQQHAGAHTSLPGHPYNWLSMLVLLSSWFALPPRSPNVICLPLSVSHPWGPRKSPLLEERSWNSALGIGCLGL